ncbi:hypothetical protein YB2330_006604 [Saitoella coloradoensis]
MHLPETGNTLTHEASGTTGASGGQGCPFSSSATTKPHFHNAPQPTTLAEVAEPLPVPPAQVQAPPNLLQSSPYPSEPHLLNMSTLDQDAQDLALALQNLRPLSKAYATTAYADAFNWDEIISSLPPISSLSGGKTRLEYYIIAFHSRLHPLTTPHDRITLSHLDSAAHAEANTHGGLLKYWFGDADEDTSGQRRNLATCVWRGREDARRAGRGPAHARAMGAVGGRYWGKKSLKEGEGEGEGEVGVGKEEGVYKEWWVERFTLWIEGGEGGRRWGLEDIRD